MRKGQHSKHPGPRLSLGMEAPLITPTPVLYLDLDECLFETQDHWESYIMFPQSLTAVMHVPEMLMRYRLAGWRVVGVASIPGVGVNRYSHDQALLACRILQHHLGVTLDLTSVCMHSPRAKMLEDKICWCRKPKGGLFIQSVERLDRMYPHETFPPYMALVVGDSKNRKSSAKSVAMPFMNFNEWLSGDHLVALEEKVSGQPYAPGDPGHSPQGHAPLDAK